MTPFVCEYNTKDPNLYDTGRPNASYSLKKMYEIKTDKRGTGGISHHLVLIQFFLSRKVKLSSGKSDPKISKARSRSKVGVGVK